MSNIAHIKIFKCLPEYFVFENINNFFIASLYLNFIETHTDIEKLPDLHCFDGNRWYLQFGIYQVF